MENAIGVGILDALWCNWCDVSNSSLELEVSREPVSSREVNTIREMRVLRDGPYKFVSILYFG